MDTTMETSAEESSSLRVHIGGLAPDVTVQELEDRFGRVALSAQCRLTDVELPQSRVTPSHSRGFAYITIVGAAAERVLEDLTKAYHKTKWRGGVLRVAKAVPDYQERLQRQWDERDALQQKGNAAVAAEHARLQPVDEINPMRTGIKFKGRKKTAFHDDDEDMLVKEEAYPEETLEEDMEEEDMEEEHVEEEIKEDEPDEWTEDAIQALIAEKLAEEATDTESDTSEATETADDPSSSVTTPTPHPGPASVSQPVLSVEEANARRLAALDEKKKKHQQDPSSTGFLGKINVVGGASGKKITFDDDGEVAEIEDGREVADKEREEAEIPGGEAKKRAVVVDWLGSDDDDHEEEVGGKADGYGELDDEKLLRPHTKQHLLQTLAFDEGQEEETEDQQRFALRPEFLGETGKKLFDLQKRFGGDQRFRMDARFIEEDENEYFAHDGEDIEILAPVVLDMTDSFLQQFQPDEDGDQLAQYAQEMTHERDQALDVVADLFPDIDVEKIKYRLEALKHKDPIKEASWMGEQMRYDPRIMATSKFELHESDRSRRAAKDDDEKLADEEKRVAEAKQARDDKEILIGGDRFYSASTSLGSLFSRVRKNSEDGEVGEAALDGVFGFSKVVDPTPESENEKNAAAVETATASVSASASAFKLSSLFDFSFGGDHEKTNELAMGGDLLEADEDEDETKPWHFTQSFNENGGTSEDPPMRLADDDTDKEDDEMDHEDVEDDTNGKRKRVRIKRSLDDFLAFGLTFCGGPTLAALTTKDAKDEWQKQWSERRKKLTLDFKRKRRDALKLKKKQQQAMQRHNAKRQKTAALGRS